MFVFHNNVEHVVFALERGPTIAAARVLFLEVNNQYSILVVARVYSGVIASSDYGSVFAVTILKILEILQRCGRFDNCLLKSHRRGECIHKVPPMVAVTRGCRCLTAKADVGRGILAEGKQ